MSGDSQFFFHLRQCAFSYLSRIRNEFMNNFANDFTSVLEYKDIRLEKNGNNTNNNNNNDKTSSTSSFVVVNNDNRTGKASAAAPEEEAYYPPDLVLFMFLDAWKKDPG